MTGLDQVILGWTIGTTELIVLLIVALLIWGRRLPEIARSMGRSVFEFKKGLREAEQAKQEIADENEAYEIRKQEEQKRYESDRNDRIQRFNEQMEDLRRNNEARLKEI
ncbi:MAG: twin-arginine translocase TatA/TatE family subunit, partial [Sedimentisphaerales bacterium]|nr:twin-arginine translocase TatA/TatE family subunit [Sedimentisphaerales bacterium]